MKKTLFACFCLMILTKFQLYAQDVIVPLWEKIESSPVNGITEGWGVDVDSEGNVYWPFNVNTNNQGLDILCYKFNSAGDALWANPLFFGGISTQQAYVCNAKSDFVYVGGRFCETNGFDCEMQLLKINKATGALIWAEEYDFGNNGYDEIDGLEIRDNSIYLGGWAQALEPGPYRSDMGLLKADLDGNTIWSNHFGELDTGEHLDGHFVVDDDFIYGCGLWNGDNAFNLYNGHAFLGKFSKVDGGIVDYVLFGNQSNAPLDIENALGMTSDGVHLYITGYTTLPGANNWQLFVAKYDKDLNEIWYKDWGGSGTETARGITVKNGVVYVAGLTQSPELATQGGADGVLVAYDTDGTFLSYRIWGDTQDNTFRDIVVQGNDIYLAGSSGDDLLTFGNSSEEAFLIKTNTNILGVNNVSYVEPIIILPNPVSEAITVTIGTQLNGPFTFQLFNMTGVNVFTDILNSNEESIKLEHIPSGLYLYSIKDLSDSTFYGKIVVE